MTFLGDFIRLIEDDFNMINETFNKTMIKSMTKNQFKRWVKSKIEKAAFDSLMQEKESKSKVCDLKYKKLQLQKVHQTYGNKK